MKVHNSFRMQALMCEQTSAAVVPPWLRVNMDINNSPADESQRMVRTLELCMATHPGHGLTFETVVCLRWRLREV